MELIFPEGMHFDCASCTKCCRGWQVHVDPQSFYKVVGSPLFKELESEHGQPPMARAEVDGEKTALTMMKGGHCVFLTKDKLCSIHRDMGEKSKPMGCRQFPFLLRPTPDGVVVGVSFYCSAVQSDRGRPLDQHAAELEDLLAHNRYDGVGDTLTLHGDLAISWNGYKRIEAFTRDCLREDDLSAGVWRALMGVGATVVRKPVDPDLTDMAPTLVDRDDVFDNLEQMFLIGVLGSLESPSAAVCKRNTEAIFMRQTFASQTFHRDVDLQRFDDFRGRFDARWSVAEFRRYLQHLVFRKLLAFERSVMANVAALALAYPLLRWYRDLSAYVHNKLQPDIDDVHLAFDVVETSFSTHSRDLDPFFMQMADVLVRQLEIIVR